MTKLRVKKDPALLFAVNRETGKIYKLSETPISLTLTPLNKKEGPEVLVIEHKKLDDYTIYEGLQEASEKSEDIIDIKLRWEAYQEDREWRDRQEVIESFLANPKIFLGSIKDRPRLCDPFYLCPPCPNYKVNIIKGSKDSKVTEALFNLAYYKYEVKTEGGTLEWGLRLSLIVIILVAFGVGVGCGSLI